MPTIASYIKLRNGRWGLLVEGDCSKGMRVFGVNQKGQSTPHIIGKIVGKVPGDKYICEIATKEQAEILAKRPKANFNKQVHTTYPAVPIPPDDGSIPFDGPYVR